MGPRVLVAATAILLLTGCPGGGAPGASPELASAFDFAAYPNGRLVETDVYPDTLFVIPGPGGRMSEFADGAGDLPDARVKPGHDDIVYAPSLTHFPPLAEDFSTASMKAIPFTPSLMVGKMTALSGFFFDRAARIAAAASV